MGNETYLYMIYIIVCLSNEIFPTTSNVFREDSNLYLIILIYN